MNQSVNDSSKPSVKAKSISADDDAHDTQEEKEDERPVDSESVTDDKRGSADSYSKAKTQVVKFLIPNQLWFHARLKQEGLMATTRW